MKLKRFFAYCALQWKGITFVLLFSYSLNNLLLVLVHYSVMVWPQIMFMAEILAFLLAYYSFVIATGFASLCEDGRLV
jgi:hypothetical protein